MMPFHSSAIVDPLWFHLLLAVHIAFGFGAFLLAPVALVTAKGGKLHRRWGKVYLYCMGGVAATALPMAFYRPILFLALVAVFSFYLAFSAYRVLRLKDLATGGHAKLVDWIAASVAFLASAALAILGIVHPSAVQNMVIPSIIFGIIGMRAAVIEVRHFLFKPTDKMFWWYNHLGNFIGSYIAAWSAFSVTTIAPRFGGGVIMWLWPTIVGVPAIIITTAYYKRKFAPRRAVVTS